MRRGCARPTSAASMSTIRRTPARFGSAATTAHRLSRSNRWTSAVPPCCDGAPSAFGQRTSGRRRFSSLLHLVGTALEFVPIGAFGSGCLRRNELIFNGIHFGNSLQASVSEQSWASFRWTAKRAGATRSVSKVWRRGESQAVYACPERSRREPTSAAWEAVLSIAHHCG